jgi:DNA-binding NarL/FixJ family response regulator
VIVLTGRCDPDHAEKYVLAGASGVLTKDRSGEHLALAIRKVHGGEVWLGRGPMAHLIEELAWNPHAAAIDAERSHIATLTAREREVVELVSAGLNNKAIASSLHISENTVRHHLTSVFGKLDVPDRLALAVYAFRHQLSAKREA